MKRSEQKIDEKKKRNIKMRAVHIAHSCSYIPFERHVDERKLGTDTHSAPHTHFPRSSLPLLLLSFFPVHFPSAFSHPFHFISTTQYTHSCVEWETEERMKVFPRTTPIWYILRRCTRGAPFLICASYVLGAHGRM